MNLNKYFTSLSVLLCVFSALAFTAKAQYVIVPVGAPCPRSSRIDSDTISFSANQPMPFDQCFYLKCILPGRVEVDRFVVIPVDAQGNLKVKRRDYYSYLHNKQTWKERRKERKSLPYKDFKKGNGLIAQQSERVTTIIKGNHTEITLDVPPLEPGREYKILLLTPNGEDAQTLLEIGQLIFVIQTAAPNAVTRMGSLDEAALLHRRNIINRYQNPNKLFLKNLLTSNDYESFDDFVNALYSFQIHFDAYNNHVSYQIDVSRPQIVPEYKLFFSPVASPPPNSNDLKALSAPPSASSPRRYQSILGNLPFTNKYDPDKPNSTLVVADILPRISTDGQHLTLNTLDTKGNSIDLASDGTYLVQVLAYDSQKPANFLGMVDVGKLTFSQHGTQVVALPDAKAYDGKWLDADNSVMGNYALIQVKQQLITNALTSQDAVSFKNGPLTYCMQSAIACPCEDKGIKDLTVREQLLNTLVFLGETDNKRRQAVAAGLSSIANLPETVKPTEYLLQQANIKSSIASLNTALEFIKKVQILTPALSTDIGALILQIEAYKLGLSTVSQNIHSIAEAEAASKTRLEKKLIGPDVRLAAVGSSSILNLVSESKLRIMPDFGFIAIFDRQEPFSKSFGPKDLSPYLGFNIGFRAMDKNIPWRMIQHKSLRHHLSFMSGLTLKSLAITNQREDFFGKTSLLIGLGYRLNNYLRITAGSVLFKEVDPNPLSDSRPVTASAFIGVSLDLDLKDLFGGISALFKL